MRGHRRREQEPGSGAQGASPSAGEEGSAVPASLSNLRRREAERKIWLRAFGLSALVHLLLVLVWSSNPLPPSPFAAPGPREADPSPAEGAMQAVSMTATLPDPVVPPSVPVPVVDVVEPPEVDEEAELELAELEEPFPGAETGQGEEEEGDELAGVESGSGAGDAGTGDEGLRRMVPPSPRGLIMPPSNENLRGTEVEVWVFVDVEGRVVPDSTRLNPPTRDRGFNDRIRREAAQWVFEPAQRDGEPVSAWFPYTISM